MKRLRLIAALFLSVVLAACQRDDSADLFGESRAAWAELWHETAHAEFRDNMLPNLFPFADLLPESDARVVAIEEAVGRIDAELRVRRPDLFATAPIPEPHVEVVHDAEPNAFVETIVLSMPVRMVLNPTLTPEDGNRVSDTLSLTRNGNLIEHDLVVPVPFSAETLQVWLAHGNDARGPCKVALDGDMLRLAEGCAARWQSFSEAKAFGFASVSSRIAFSSGLLGLARTPDEQLFLAAHELSHYYRADPVQDTSRLRFLYRPNERSPDGEPVPDDAATRLLRDLSSNGAALEAAIARGELDFHTEERAADGFALETMLMLGADPAAAEEVLLRLLATVPQPDGWGEARCRAAAAQGFRNPDGSWMEVPHGSLRQAHPSVCRRVFNLRRGLVGVS